ncbi:MAG TPA: sulfotransferase [Steroidobacteraceae bacterium]|nr:sulfotransferase [Steroidobacteraceae bacterium]
MDTSQTVAAPNASEVPRIRGLIRRREFTEALSAGEALLADAPDERDALLFVAIAQRYLGRTSEALATLARLERHHPRFSRLHEERGHCFIALKQAPQAIEAFLFAVNLNHALPASWSMLEGLYRMSGQADNCAMAASHVATLRKLPREVVTATGLFMDGDLDAAEPMIRSYLLEHGNEVEAMRLLARIGMARKVYEDAELLLAAIMELAPDYRAARSDYAEVLIEMHKYSQARRELDQLLREDPANQRHYRGLYAVTSVGLGEHERAVELYRELIALTPQDPDLHLSMAHALKTMGKRDEAIQSYRTAEACRPGFGDAYWSLANLKTYRFTDEEFTRLKELQSAPEVAVIDRYHLHFALGKALEDRGDFPGSFHCYELGNALRRSKSNYRPEIIEKNTRQQIEVCTREFFTRREGWGAPDPDPIFIVGLPRSGSTLLEQILASHSRVEGTQELSNVQQIVATLRGRDPDLSNPRYPRILPELEAKEVRHLGEQYLTDTRVYRLGKPNPVPFFIDKMPNNFRHLGLIRLMLPRAKVIDARREPVACCFSNLKQLYARGQEFTYSVDDIARYYRTYLELMKHWDEVLPGWILRVHHEDVVDDLESNVRRLLDFCGLEFEPQCIEFHKTARSVRTASSEQVRQPIYREGLDQWKNFEPWLEPLKLALGDALTRYRDE